MQAARRAAAAEMVVGVAAVALVALVAAALAAATVVADSAAVAMPHTWSLPWAESTSVRVYLADSGCNS